ncbi:MAG: glycosyltransferase, partial [Anaerolineales bacterium]|nr:glycosyltransferase [Anaerolineales bacterium]
MMRITLITIGSRGDVEPFVALGKGLSEAGFRVCLASHERFRAFVTAYGLEFRPVAGDPREILQKAEGQTLLA